MEALLKRILNYGTVMKNKYTKKENGFVCNDCGAYSSNMQTIDHYAGCQVESEEFLENCFLTEEEEGYEWDNDE